MNRLKIRRCPLVILLGLSNTVTQDLEKVSSQDSPRFDFSRSYSCVALTFNSLATRDFQFLWREILTLSGLAGVAGKFLVKVVLKPTAPFGSRIVQASRSNFLGFFLSVPTLWSLIWMNRNRHREQQNVDGHAAR